MIRLKCSTFSIILFISLFIYCGGGITPSPPEGFGRWAEDCSGFALAINQSDFDSRPFMGHQTNQRCDLHLCDDKGEIIKTFFQDRKVDGAPSVIDSMIYLKNQDCIIIYIYLLGTGTVKKENITISTGTIQTLGIIDVMKYTGSDRYIISYCNGKSLEWDFQNSKIKIGD
jgi:hypothetical protein